jgi:hypothetical protein
MGIQMIIVMRGTVYSRRGKAGRRKTGTQDQDVPGAATTAAAQE